MRKNGKRLVSLIMAVMMGLSCGACSGKNEKMAAEIENSKEIETVTGTDKNVSQGTDKEVEAKQTEKEIELVWATFKGGWADILEEIFDVYESEHPNVHISLYTGESGDFFADLKALLATDSLPNIFNMRGDNFGAEWAEHLQDVGNSAAAANVKEGFTDSFTWNGVTYGAYYNYEIHGVTWDMNVLKELGYETYPVNNTEYKKVLEDMKAAGKTGAAYFATQQLLYNHLGNAPLVLHKDVAGFYEEVVSGKADPVTDQYFNEYFDWLQASMPYINENPISLDQTTGTAQCFTTDDFAWSIIDGTSGLYYGYDTDYTEHWEVGPLCINDKDPYYVLNCQGYVVSNTGDEETNAAALDLYNWFYTSDYVAETLTKNFNILTTSSTYTLPEDVLDTFTYKAYQAIQTFDSKPITYYMPSELCTEYAAIEQQFIAGVLTKEEALKAVGEAFRKFG